MSSCCSQKERVQNPNNTCTLLRGPWCPCSADRSHPYWRLDIFKAHPCLPDRSDPQWFKDCHTQQHNNDTTHISCPVLSHWCNSEKKKELVYLIHNTYTSPKVQAFLPANSREQSESSFSFLLSVSLSNSPATEAQLSVRRSGRLLTRLNSLLPNFSS